MLLVHPTLVSNIKRLEVEFAHGYQIGTNVFYVSLTIKKGDERTINIEERMSWGLLWNEENYKFKIFLKATSTLSSLKDKMFFICDGIHCYKAWIDYIIKLHKMDLSKHIFVWTPEGRLEFF